MEHSGQGAGLACGETGTLKEKWLWGRAACRKGNFLTALLIFSEETRLSVAVRQGLNHLSLLFIFYLYHLV